MTNPKTKYIVDTEIYKIEKDCDKCKKQHSEAYKIHIQQKEKWKENIIREHEEEIKQLNRPEIRFAKDVKCLKDYGKVLLKEQREAIRDEKKIYLHLCR